MTADRAGAPIPVKRDANDRPSQLMLHPACTWSARAPWLRPPSGGLSRGRHNLGPQLCSHRVEEGDGYAAMVATLPNVCRDGPKTRGAEPVNHGVSSPKWTVDRSTRLTTTRRSRRALSDGRRGGR